MNRFTLPAALFVLLVIVLAIGIKHSPDKGIIASPLIGKPAPQFSLPSLTARDANSNTLEDMFDFDNSPSLNLTLTTAPLPQQPPAQNPGDPGCPFS